MSKRKSNESDRDKKKRRKRTSASDSENEASDAPIDSEFSDMSGADEDETPNSIRHAKAKAPKKTKKRTFDVFLRFPAHLAPERGRNDPKRVKGRDWGVQPLRKYFSECTHTGIPQASADMRCSQKTRLLLLPARKKTRKRNLLILQNQCNPESRGQKLTPTPTRRKKRRASQIDEVILRPLSNVRLL